MTKLWWATSIGCVLALGGCSPNKACTATSCVAAPPASSPTPATCGELVAGALPLSPSNSLTSCDGRFTLTVQADGNLVLYRRSVGALWASGTGNGATATMQADGNFVLYDAAAHPTWASNTADAGATLSLQNDGNLVIAATTGKPLWATNTSELTQPGPPTACGMLRANQELQPWQSLLSCDGNHTLGLWGQHVVLHNGSATIWTSPQGPGERAILQPDGNFVLYDAAGAPAWASNTNGHPNAQLAVQDDGNVVVYDASGAPLWSTATNGR